MFIVVLVTFICLLICYTWYKHRFSYWSRKRIPVLNPKIPFGDAQPPWKGIPACIQCIDIYNVLKNRSHKHGGIYGGTLPIFFPTDPEQINNIFTKDFQYFTSRGLHPNDRILQNLFTQEENEWRTLRQKLCPLFSPGKMKEMFNTMLNCTDPLINEIERLTANKEIIDIKDVAVKYNIDVIGSCLFGIKVNSFSNKDSDFRKYGSMIFEESLFKSLRGLILFNHKNLSVKLGINILEKEAERFFTELVTDICNDRKENNIQYNDFLQRLIELKDSDTKLGLTLGDIIAQSYAFLVGGFDTTSSLITLCFFEIARHCGIQRRLKKEVRNVLSNHGHNGNVTYEALKDMKYMDQVINETMRKYPIIPLLSRECTKEYNIPSTNTVLDRGTLVFISVLALHRDPSLFPDPDKFNPERFSEENRKKIITGSYHPFGNGPRICIGMRFGIIQAKIFLVALLEHFEFTVNSKTQVPLELDLKFTTSAKGGVWLNSVKQLETVPSHIPKVAKN